MRNSAGRVTICFLGDLWHLLGSKGRHEIDVFVDGTTTVKHIVESLGVPHCDVEGILADHMAVDFSYLPRGGEKLDIYPVGMEVPVENPVALRPKLQTPIRFVLDAHLGQLATWLRLFGFDSLYSNTYDDPELAEISCVENRVLLSRDRGLLKYKSVTFGHCVRSNDPRQQLIDVLRRYQLLPHIRLWQRCVHCNGLLESVDKMQILDQLQPKTRLYYHDFQRCTTCGQIYWRGSHFTKMAAFVEGVVQEVEIKSVSVGNDRH